MPRQKVTIAPEVSTDVMKAEAIALVQQSSITELEAAINTTLLQGDELLRRSDLGRLEFTLNTLEVTNPGQLANAGRYLADLKDGKAKYVAYWNSDRSLKKVFYAIWKLLCQSQATGEKRYDDAIAQVESVIKPYIQQLKAEEDANQRQIAEAADLKRKAAENQAHTLILEGNMVAAAEVKAQAQSIRAPVLPTESVVMEGLSARPKKVVTVTDPMELVKAIAEGKAPIGIIKEWNIAFLQDQAKQNIVYPGTKVDDDISFARRRD